MLNSNKIIFGILKSTVKEAHAPLERAFESYTLSWLRYGYYGDIIEGTSISTIIKKAYSAGYQYCFILKAGILIKEQWIPEYWSKANLENHLPKWIAEKDFFLTGFKDKESPNHLLNDALLVNLAYYPDFQSLQLADVLTIPTDKLPILFFDRIFEACLLNIRDRKEENNNSFTELLKDGIAKFDAQNTTVTTDQKDFLKTIHLHFKNGRKGVFLWNLEPYTDIEIKPEGLYEPLTSLYSVAAGFKPNRILETHGFDEDTTVCFFDYSPNALKVKEIMLKEWDGDDFPQFIRYLFKKFPYPETYYHLWDDLTPGEIDWKDMDKYWENELARWGGSSAFKNHWSRYRKLNHKFLNASILADQQQIIDKIDKAPNAVIWWSNAFFTIYSNWFFTPTDRQKVFEQWIQALAEKNPTLFIYGSDFQNISINHINAADYLTAWQNTSHSIYQPLNTNSSIIRF